MAQAKTRQRDASLQSSLCTQEEPPSGRSIIEREGRGRGGVGEKKVKGDASDSVCGHVRAHVGKQLLGAPGLHAKQVRGPLLRAFCFN